jgi:choline dehydrogenase
VPHIVHNYLDAEYDCRLSVKAMHIARQLAGTRALAAVVVAENWPGAACDSDEALLAHARRYGSTGYHPVGTCRMGIDPGAVLDPQLRVKGVTGLRVADAAVMPRLVSGNTNAAAIMIGEKAADMLRDRTL